MVADNISSFLVPSELFPYLQACNLLGSYVFNAFVPNAPFLYSLKTSESRKISWCFQGVEKGCIRNKWVNTLFNLFDVKLSSWMYYSYLPIIGYTSYFLRLVEAVVRTCSAEKVFLEISQNPQGNTFVRVSFLIERSGTLLKKETLAQVFSCELCEICKNTFFKEHFGWLLMA